MADPDPSKPEPSKSKSNDLDFDLDFDLGDLDFEEDLDDAPASKPGSTPAKDALTKDLDALTAAGGKDEDEDEEPDLEEEPDLAPVSEQEPEVGEDPSTAESPEEGAVEGDDEPEEEMEIAPGEEDQIEPSEIEIDEGEEEIDIADDDEEDAPPEPEAPAKEAKAAEAAEAPDDEAAGAAEIVFDEDDDLDIEFDEETDLLETAAEKIDEIGKEAESAEDPHLSPRHIPLTRGGEELDDDIADSDDDIAPLELETPPEMVEADEVADGDEQADDEEFDEAPEEVSAEVADAGKKSGLKLPNFKPLELAGIAAVMIVCLGALVMLSNTVSGMLKPARDAATQTEKSVPRKIEGEKLSLSGIECYWRNRLETDRVNRFSTILPLVKIAAGNGDGQMQIRFLDSQGEMRGDAHTFKLDGSNFSPGGASALALSTEGLSNEVQFAAYRSGDEDSEDDRWTAEIHESADGINWTKVVAFEIPTERRASE